MIKISISIYTHTYIYICKCVYMHALLTTVHVPETWMKEHLPGQKCLHKSTQSILIPESDQGKPCQERHLWAFPPPVSPSRPFGSVPSSHLVVLMVSIFGAFEINVRGMDFHERASNQNVLWFIKLYVYIRVYIYIYIYTHLSGSGWFIHIEFPAELFTHDGHRR